MAQSTIEQFASELKMPAGALLEQLSAAGVDAKKAGDKLTEQDKTRLLDYLRKQHGAQGDAKKRITLTRKQTSEIRAADSSGTYLLKAPRRLRILVSITLVWTTSAIRCLACSSKRILLTSFCLPVRKYSVLMNGYRLLKVAKYICSCGAVAEA